MKFATFLLAVMLSGCAGAKNAAPVAPGPFPENYEELVNNYLKSTLKDPYSIRELSITRPRQDRVWVGLINGGRTDAWRSCVSYNAKNSYGGYTGTKGHIFLFNDGKITSVLEPQYKAVNGGC